MSKEKTGKTKRKSGETKVNKLYHLRTSSSPPRHHCHLIGHSY